MPANVVAVVHLDAARVDGVADGGRPVTNNAGISNAQAADGTVQLTVGSGSYRFSNHTPVLAAVGTTKSSSSSKTALLVALGALVLLGVGLGMGIALRRKPGKPG